MDLVVAWSKPLAIMSELEVRSRRNSPPPKSKPKCLNVANPCWPCLGQHRQTESEESDAARHQHPDGHVLLPSGRFLHRGWRIAIHRARPPALADRPRHAPAPESRRNSCASYTVSVCEPSGWSHAPPLLPAEAWHAR